MVCGKDSSGLSEHAQDHAGVPKLTAKLQEAFEESFF